MLVIKQLHSSLWIVILVFLIEEMILQIRLGNSVYENSYDSIVFMISVVAFAKISQQRNQATGAVFIIGSYDRDENGRPSAADKAVALKLIKSI